MDLESETSEPAWAGRLERTPFAAALATGAPLIVAKGEPPRLEFATSAALDAFGVAAKADLETILFSGEGFASRRLRRLAVETPAGAAPRLELLRFFVSRRPVGVNWLCARVNRPDGAFFVAAETAARGETLPEPTNAPAVEAPPFQPLPLDGPVRFVWRLDEQARFAPPDAALSARLGPNAPREGEALEAFLKRAALDPEGEWARAWRAQATFSGLSLVWPEPGGTRARRVLLSGAPVFESNRRFQGFRGFGVFTGEGVDLTSPAAIEAPAEIAPAPEAEPPPPPNADSELKEAAAAPNPGGANALIGLLQRQHAMPAQKPNGGATAPAMAVISALASLLQTKTRPTPAPAPPEAAPRDDAGGAEIVQLRPGAPTTPANDQAASSAPRDSETVSLTSQERDAFKEIARALTATALDGRSEPPPPPLDDPHEPPHPDEQDLSGTTQIAQRASPRADDDIANLVDNLPIAALVIRGRETLYANRTLLDLAGYRDLEDFRQRDGLSVIFRGRDPETLAAAGAGAGIPLVAAGDRILTVDAQIGPTRWGGETATMVAMRRSLEADHQAEVRAMERETDMYAARARDYAAALDAARDGMVRLDATGRILGMNKGAERLLGYDQSEAAGESFLTLLAPSSHAAATTALDQLTKGETGPLAPLDAHARDHAGRLFAVRLDLGRFPNQPEPDYFLLLSDRSTVEIGAASNQSAVEEAESASQAKTELLSRVSHEMRTPLHAIMGFAEVILQERFGPIGNDRYRDYIRDILASARHVLSLAGDLLDMSKIELGKMDLAFAPIDINRVIRECVALMQPQAARERIIMRLSLYDRLPNVMADERSLKQIMLNLMSNAVKYNEPGGQVIVSTALDDAGAAIVRVRDTGVGMSESDLAIALEPFRRVPGAKIVEGSGLGLPLTKALVEANHADFTIKSRKDQGTLVEIAFPVKTAAQ